MNKLTIALKPRGNPSPGARWADPKPHIIVLVQENAESWFGRPVDNFHAENPPIEYPKFAWEAAVPHHTTTKGE